MTCCAMAAISKAASEPETQIIEPIIEVELEPEADEEI